MAIEAQRQTTGGNKGFGIVKEAIELIVDEPTAEFQTPYTVIMPRPLTDVRLRRQFTKGRCTVYDPEVAREFQATYHYAVEPDLPPGKPRKKKARRYPIEERD